MNRAPFVVFALALALLALDSGAPRRHASAAEPSLRAAILQALHAHADERFAFVAHDARLSAAHPSQDLRVALEADRVVLSDRRGADPLAFSLRRLNGSAVGPAVVQRSGARVELVRDALIEWYAHGPLGLEQGFTVARAPTAQTTLSLELSVAGAGYASTSRGDRIEFTRGDRTIVVSELYAYDADHTRLRSRMTHVDGLMRVEVDATGARYPVVIDPMWAEQTILTRGVGNFGASVAVSGDTAVVGAPQGGAGAHGEAYVFVRSGGGWVEQAPLSALDGAISDFFGEAVAISGDRAVIGAPRDDDGGSESGAAYVFVRSGTMWTQEAKLTASDAAAGDRFGNAVSIDGDTLVVGASQNADGAVYAFARGANWTEQARMLPTSSAIALGGAFGCAVSLSRESVLIGANLHNVRGTDSGAAFVFTRAGTSWTQQAELIPSGTAAGEHFGTAVALDGNRAVVGAPEHAGGSTAVGRVDFFVRTGVSWATAPRMGLPTAGSGDRLGGAVAISGDFAAAAAPRDDVDGRALAGSVHVWALSGGIWRYGAMLTASDSATMDTFGRSLALSGSTLIAGRAARAGVGAAYVFAYGDVTGVTCALPADCLSGFCTDGVCCDVACGDGALDCQACSATAGGTANGTCTALSATRAPMVTCRASTGVCDIAETCTPSATTCPVDAAPADTCCTSDVDCNDSDDCTSDVCGMSDGVCVNTPIAGCPAAPDAGSADAGFSDAGLSDAGASDAGERDAGERDAGESDAGDSDAATPDAGSDTGNIDAGHIDAGNRDGGAGDAGTTSRLDDGGCGCRVAPRGGTTGAPLLLSLALLLALRMFARRRRVR